MTTTRDELRADARDVLADTHPDPTAAWWATRCLALIEQLDQAETERDRWKEMWRQRGIKHLKAEARIRAVQDVLDKKDADLDAMSNPPREHRGVLIADIRRALEGES